MPSQQQPIPHEVMSMIVREVDDCATLYALLTTCKTLFRFSVRQLWEDPFRFAFEPRQFKLLLKRLLAISPCTVLTVVSLRLKYGVSCQWTERESEQALQNQDHEGDLYIDYLALVRHIQLGYARLSSLIKDTKYREIEKALPWIICNGNFDRILTLAISPREARDYYDSLSTMTRLTRLYWVIHVRGQPYAADISAFVRRLVEAQGERGRQVDIEIVPTPQVLQSFTAHQHLLEVCKMLTPYPTNKRTIVNQMDWARCLAHVDNVDFSRIREAKLMEVDEERLKTIDNRLLGALNPVGVPVSAVPPLRRIFVAVAIRDIMPFVDDLAMFFGGTLEVLDLILNWLPVIVSSNNLDGNSLANASFLSGEWNFLTLDQGHMSGMPRLERLSLNDGKFQESFCYSRVYSVPSSTANSLSTFGSWRLSELRTLYLNGLSVAQFDPMSLMFSSKLEKLDLCMDLAFTEA
ncbi:hypothetical protein BGZ73_001398 [Actinomortierella ambigua]|nr:hypothetical protein BGZ73_001391 [Actinomortierella ambigua]KAF9975075.1 hypothetical protein BGZ73_001398 [Actinomortierella ambigua]